MTSKSKTKGKSWERDVCNFLSELYQGSFIRVPNSGAYVGGKNEYRKDTLSEEQIKLARGDIVPPQNYPYFLAECKNYADFPFHSLLAKSTISQLDNWINQVEHDVTTEDDLWLLFIKITRKGTYVLFDRNLYNPYVHSNISANLPYGAKYRNYWFTEMNHFFNIHKDKLEVRWKNGRERKEDQHSV